MRVIKNNGISLPDWLGEVPNHQHSLCIPCCLEIFIPGKQFDKSKCKEFRRDFYPCVKYFSGDVPSFKISGFNGIVDVVMQSPGFNTDMGFNYLKTAQNYIYCKFKFMDGNLVMLDGAILINDEANEMCAYIIKVSNGVLSLSFLGASETALIADDKCEYCIMPFAERITLYDDDYINAFRDAGVSFDISNLNLSQLFFMLNNYFNDPSIISRIIEGTNAYRREKVRKQDQQS